MRHKNANGRNERLCSDRYIKHAVKEDMLCTIAQVSFRWQVQYSQYMVYIRENVPQYDWSAFLSDMVAARDLYRIPT